MMMARPTAASSGKEGRGSRSVKPEKSTTRPAGTPRRKGDEFGLEGTNKTVATPKPDDAAPDELGLGPHIDKTPYTRG
jgi:hypothetical protein